MLGTVRAQEGHAPKVHLQAVQSVASPCTESRNQGSPTKLGSCAACLQTHAPHEADGGSHHVLCRSAGSRGTQQSAKALFCSVCRSPDELLPEAGNQLEIC